MKLINLIQNLDVIIIYFEDLIKEAETTDLYESYHITLTTLNDIKEVLVNVHEYVSYFRKLTVVV